MAYSFALSRFPSPTRSLFSSPSSERSGMFVESPQRDPSTTSSMISLLSASSPSSGEDEPDGITGQDIANVSLCHVYRPFLRLLGNEHDLHHDPSGGVHLLFAGEEQSFRDLQSTPMFTSAVKQQFFETHGIRQKPFKDPLPQFGLLGLRKRSNGIAQSRPESHPQANLIFSNMQAPWSAFICGAQGSGKSHTLSCLLENAMTQNEAIGNLPNPLTGLVFHWDKFSSFNSTQICEAAYLCSAGIPVTVLVAPSSLRTMTHLYTNLPGLPKGCPQPRVMPLYFQEDQLNIENMMTLMAVHDVGEGAPLYIGAIRNILRQMAIENQDRPGLDYKDFRARLAQLPLTGGQLNPLNVRLSLIESMLAAPSLEGDAARQIWKFEEGSLTILDLSDSFVHESDACALFNICLKLFMDSRNRSGRIIALDEAHKFLSRSRDAAELTDALISIVRQQRHLAARVMISTQEPTLSPQFLDLCNVSIVHRFNSPAWYDVLRKHLAGANLAGDRNQSLFETILGLNTGEALLFCPTAVLEISGDGKPIFLKDKCERVMIRNRITADGGRSIMASDKNAITGERAEVKLSVVPYHVMHPLPAPGSLARPNKKSRGNANGTTLMTFAAGEQHTTRRITRSMTSIDPSHQTSQAESTPMTALPALTSHPVGEAPVPVARPNSPALIQVRNRSITYSMLREAANAVVYEILNSLGKKRSFNIREWRRKVETKLSLPPGHIDQNGLKNRCNELFRDAVREFYSEFINSRNLDGIPGDAKNFIGSF